MNRKERIDRIAKALKNDPDGPVIHPFEDYVFEAKEEEAWEILRSGPKAVVTYLVEKAGIDIEELEEQFDIENDDA